MKTLIEVNAYNIPKYGQNIAGDTFDIKRIDDNSLIITLADGMGSGVKANVLSGITTSMIQKFMSAGIGVVRAASAIMQTLPVCSVRKVSYSTFTTLNIAPNGLTKVIEYDNPEMLLFRDTLVVPYEREQMNIETNTTRNNIYHTEIKLQLGDRLIFFSDGVTQSGMGTKSYPLGWRISGVRDFIKNLLQKNIHISAKELSKEIVSKSELNDLRQAKDDITCVVAYYRQARELLLVSGPPYDRDMCPFMVEKFKAFTGKKIISGGTTSQIIADGTKEDIKIDMTDIHSDIPPRSNMNGADLVTEGMLTMNKVLKILAEEEIRNIDDIDAAYRMVQLLLDSDVIHCLIGTAVNEAHQNPNMPAELGLRRISVNALAKILREKFLKQVDIKYI